MSYNSLFGLGTHAADASLEGWWKLDDNAASTVIVDSSGSSANMSLQGGDNTSDASVTGPGGWLASAIAFNETTASHAVTSTSSPDPSGDVTFFAWVKTTDSTDGHIYGGYDSSSPFSGFGVAQGISGSVPSGVLTSWTGSSWGNSGAPTFQDGTWHHVGVVSDSGTSRYYIDSVEEGTVSQSSPAASGAVKALAARSDGTQTIQIDMAEAVLFDRALSAAESGEVKAGPEPLNLTAPVISQTATKISTTDGSWDSQANGTITYTYQWEVADDASGTNAENRGVLNAMYPKRGDNGKYVRVTIAAANDGGIDDAETQTTAWTLITADVTAEGKTAVVTGSLTATASSTLDLTQSGFGTPNAAFLMWSSTTTAAEEESDPQFGYGVWTADGQYGVGIASVGAAGPERGFTDDIIYSPDLFRASAASITDGIRLTVEGANTSVTSFDITAILFDSNCFAEVGLSSPANLDFDPQVNSLEFSGTGALFIGNNGEFNTNGASSAGSHCLLSYGVMDTYGRMAGWCGGQLTAGTNWAWMDSDFIAGQYSSGTSRTWYMSSEWSNAGYSLNMTMESGSASGDDIAWLALGNVGCNVGIENDPGANGQSTFKSKGTTAPETTMFLSTIMQSTSTRATGAEAGCMGIGIDNQATSKFYGFLFDESDTADNGCLYNADDSQVNWVSLGGGTHIKVKEASVSSFGSGAYTLDYTTGTGTQRKFAAITFGSMVPADPGYNWQYGLGKWATKGPDDGLLQYYLMDDNAASTTITDSSGNSSDGTAGANTNTFQGSSPGIAGLTGSLAFNTASAGVTFSKPTITINGAEGITCLWRHKYVVGDERGDDEVWIGSRHSVRKSNGDAAPGTEGLVLASNGQGSITTATTVTDQWQTWAWIIRPDQHEVYIDGVEDANSPAVGTAGGGDRDLDMLDPGGIDSCSGDFAAMALWSKDLSFANTEQYRLGPEPTSDGPPILGGTFEVGQVVNVSDPNFDLHNNGTGVYTYQWYTADDAAGNNPVVIGGATSSSYTIQAGDETKYLGCFVTATNDGGNDPVEDTYSAFTLVTSGGGGPTFEPFWAIHATVIIQ